jgi:PAS domain S-box-containing protein
LVKFESSRRRKDGSVFDAALSLSPMRNSDGEVIGVSAIARDMTERNQRERSLRESQRRLNAVLNNATVAIFLMDERQHCVYMNAAAERLTGYSLPDTLGRPLHDVIHHTRPDGSHFPLEECAIDRALPEEHQMQGEEVFVHKDGSFYPVAFTASPIQDEGSRPIGTIIEVRDIRAEKQAQEHQRVLINELNHRVKNTLATVQSIAAQTLRNAPNTQEAKEALEGRLFALSRTHDVLTRESWEGADLHDIAAQAVEPYSTQGEDRLHLNGPHVRLPPRMALALAMAFQELATNAVKYGALSVPGGEIRITWTVDPLGSDKDLHLRWEERDGPPVEPPARRGFGTRLIERSLAQDLGGDVRIEFAPNGVVCTVAAPLESS